MNIKLYFNDSGDWHTLGTYSIHEVQEAISIIKVVGVDNCGAKYVMASQEYNTDERAIVLCLDSADTE